MVSFRAKFCGDYVSWNIREKAGGIKGQDLSNSVPLSGEYVGRALGIPWSGRKNKNVVEQEDSTGKGNPTCSHLSFLRHEKGTRIIISINNSHPEFHFRFGAFLVKKHPLDHSVDNTTDILSSDFVLDARDTTEYQGSHL